MPMRLAIDFGEMQMAFEDRDGDGRWFLDATTGEVIRLGDEDEELAEQIENDHADRYRTIPFQGSEVGYRDMTEFVATVSDNRLRGLLDVSLGGKGAFRRFKDVLQDSSDERERWFAFQKSCMERRIRRWLESEGLEGVQARAGN